MNLRCPGGSRFVSLQWLDIIHVVPMIPATLSSFPKSWLWESSTEVQQPNGASVARGLALVLNPENAPSSEIRCLGTAHVDTVGDSV